MLKSDRWIRLPALFDPAGVVCLFREHRIPQEWVQSTAGGIVESISRDRLTGQALLNDDLELLNRRLDENGGECQGEVNSKVNSEQA